MHFQFSHVAAMHYYEYHVMCVCAAANPIAAWGFIREDLSSAIVFPD